MIQYRNLTIAAILFAATGCSSGKGAPPGTASTSAPPQSPAVETMTLRKGALPQQVKLPAQLAAFEEVSIFPKVNGYVKDVFVDVGSAVRKGQLLKTLEAPELQQASTQAHERYARAKLDATIRPLRTTGECCRLHKRQGRYLP